MESGILFLGMFVILVLLFVVAISYSHASTTPSTPSAASGPSGPSSPPVLSTPSHEDELSSFFKGLSSTPAPITPAGTTSDTSSAAPILPIVAPDVPGIEDVPEPIVAEVAEPVPVPMYTPSPATVYIPAPTPEAVYTSPPVPAPMYSPPTPATPATVYTTIPASVDAASSLDITSSVVPTPPIAPVPATWYNPFTRKIEVVKPSIPTYNPFVQKSADATSATVYTTIPASVDTSNTVPATTSSSKSTPAPRYKLVKGRCPHPGGVVNSTKTICSGPCPAGTTLDGLNCVDN